MDNKLGDGSATEAAGGAITVKSARNLDQFSALRMMPRSRLEVMGASLVINVLSLVFPLVMLQTYDRILPNKSLDTLSLLVIGVAIALAIDAALRFTRDQVTGWAGARFDHSMGCETVRRLLGSTLTAYEQDPAGVHLERVSALDMLRDFYSGQALTAVIDLPFVLLFFAIIAYLAGFLVLVPLALLVIFGFAAWRLGGRLHAALKERSQADDRRFTFLIEVLSRIHTAKAFGMEALMTRRYEHLLETGAVPGYEVNYLSGRAQNLGAIFSQVTMVLVAGIGSLLVISGDLTVGGLVACTLLSGRSLQPLLRAMGAWTQFQNIRLARERINYTLTIETEETSIIPAPELSGGIAFDDVTFGYRADGEPLFRNLSFRIPAGDIVGITGDSGSGKSTLLLLIMRLYEPQSGRVLLDGYDLSLFDPKSVRRQLAYIPQNGTLFEGTILQNITGFQDEANVDAALAVANALGMADAIGQMRDGYHTPVGGGNSETIPAGLRQRIAIARALYAARPIVLFDEANLNVDARGDADIARALAGLKGESTVILVSDRPAILGLADRIYTLAGGTLVEQTAADAARLKVNLNT